MDGNQKLVLGFMSQLMKYHTFKMLSQLAFDGFAADEAEILSWANNRVAAAATATGQQGDLIKIASFNDPELATGIYLLYLLNSVRPIVNWEVVTDGDTPHQQELNAKYVISIARKMGAAVFLDWEDIVEVKAKSIMLFVASIMLVDSGIRRARMSAAKGLPGDDLDD